MCANMSKRIHYNVKSYVACLVYKQTSDKPSKINKKHFCISKLKLSIGTILSEQ